MWILDHIRSIVSGFVVPAVLILVGVFATLFLTQAPEPLSDRQPIHTDEGRVHIRDHGAEIQTFIDVAPGEISTTLVLRSLSGRELARLIAFRNDALVLESAESGPNEFVFHHSANGSVGLAVSNNPRVSLSLLAPADGSSEFVVNSREGRRPSRLVPVGPKGELSSWSAPNITRVVVEPSPKVTARRAPDSPGGPRLPRVLPRHSPGRVP